MYFDVSYKVFCLSLIHRITSHFSLSWSSNIFGFLMTISLKQFINSSNVYDGVWQNLYFDNFKHVTNVNFIYIILVMS